MVCMNKLFGIFILGIVLLGCVAQPQIPPEQQVNTTAYAKIGDNVSVDYTLKLADGSVLDTSLESVAKEFGLFDKSSKYSPLSFTINSNSGLIPGFVNGVMGMKVGETKEVVVQPEYGYGKVDSTKIYSIPLFYNKSKFEKVPRSLLESQKKKIEKENVVSYDNDGMVVIVDFDNETVTLEYIFQVGYEFKSYGFPQKVVNVSNDTLVIKTNVKLGDNLLITVDGTQKPMRVTSVNSTDAVIDGNHPLAGKDLIYNVKINKIIDDTQEKINSLLKMNLHIKDAEIELKDDSADIKVKHNIPKQAQEELKKSVEKTIPSIKNLAFTIAKEEKTEKK